MNTQETVEPRIIKIRPKWITAAAGKNNTYIAKYSKRIGFNYYFKDAITNTAIEFALSKENPELKGIRRGEIVTLVLDWGK